MTPIFPEKLNVFCINKKKFLSNIVVYIAILSGSKNKYGFEPFLTDFNGQFVITHEMVENRIEMLNANYPMDYNGSIEKCSGIEFFIENLTELKMRVEKVRKFYPDSAVKLENLFRSSFNNEIKSKIIKLKFPLDSNYVYLELDN